MPAIKQALAPQWLAEGRLDTTLASDRFNEAQVNGLTLELRY